MKQIFLFYILTSFLLGVELQPITVNSDHEPQQSAPSFETIFNEKEYLQQENYIPNAPSQKSMLIDEAKFIPGTQGDPLKAIKSLSGITSSNDATGELLIHGSKPEESITTINHLPIGYLYHFGGIHSVIAPESVEQLDVYLGGFDVTYGNAMGGVIDITPKYPSDDFGGSAHIGLYDASFEVNVGVSPELSFFIGGRRSYLDYAFNASDNGFGLIDPEKVTEFPNYYDLNFMMVYQPNSYHSFSVEALAASDSFNITTDGSNTDPLAVGDIEQQKEFTSIGLRHQSFYNNYSSNTLIYTHTSHQNTQFYDGYFVKFDNQEFGLFHQSTVYLDNHKLIAGLEIQNLYVPFDGNTSAPPTGDDFDFNFSDAPKYTISTTLNLFNTSLFLEDIYSINDDVTIRYGARFAHSSYQNFGGYVDPRAAVVYSLSDNEHLSVSFGQYSQAPAPYKTLDEFNNNTQLKYERAYHLNFHYDVQLNESNYFDIEPYYKQYLDLAIDDNNVTNYSSGGEGYAYGVDLSYKYRQGNYYAYLAYTFLQSQRELNVNNPTLYRFYGEIPHTLQALGSVRFADNFVFSTFAKYHSGAPITKVEGVDGSGNPIYGEPFKDRLPDYFSLNLKIAQEIKLKNNSQFEWSFEIMNITNHENISGIDYTDNYQTIEYTYQLPLIPWFDVTYRF